MGNKISKLHCQDCDGIGNFVRKAYVSEGYIYDEDLISCSTCQGTGLEDADETTEQIYEL